ncbi:MAG: site-2 protease family protein [Defluviitaleaceae bacterium]|nr:site-2 protease family protein [Defluviitaleaceae bacterium]
MSTIIPILIFLLILGIVVFVHELGHYLGAKRAGVFVEEFALGMGPLLLSFRGKWESVGGDEAQTLYSLRMFPIGGFCKMRGQDDENDPSDDRSLNNKTIPQRMLVMAGGSIMNFILAFIVFFSLTALEGYRVAEIRGVVDGSPAQQAGLQTGDHITHINGTRVTLYENFLLQLEFSGGEELDVRFRRDGQRHHVALTPVYGSDGIWRMGIYPGGRVGLLQRTAEGWNFMRPVPEGFNRVSVWGTATTAAEMMLFNIRLPFTILARRLNNQNIPDGANIMGPIGMAGELTGLYQHVITEHGVIQTILTMLFFTALLSTALGLFNLLPIPAMDGARLVFLLIEGIRRKPVPPEREGMVHLIGFILIITLAIVIAWRDIVRLLPSNEEAAAPRMEYQTRLPEYIEYNP